jgi:hypothetical protein
LKKRPEARVIAGLVFCIPGFPTLSRFERGRSPEFGARKLLAVLAVLGMELDPVLTGQSGTLDDLRRERNQARS